MGNLSRYAGPVFKVSVVAVDCGIVLDRREYPELGPDGDDVGPTGPVSQVVSIISAELAAEGSSVTIETSKRAITVSFGAPIDGYDPSVDLIAALTRRSGEGLWIPNSTPTTGTLPIRRSTPTCSRREREPYGVLGRERSGWRREGTGNSPILPSRALTLRRSPGSASRRT